MVGKEGSAVTDRVTIAGIAAITAITVSLVTGVAFGPRDQAPPQVPPAATVPAHLPPCDSDVPGLPVTGQCWLWDDDDQGVTRIRIFPYPYAPTPLYVLEGTDD
jgi:hypothetical protein